MCAGGRDNFSDMYEIIGFARTIVHIYIPSHEMGICLSNVPSMRPTTTNRCIKQLHCSLPCTKHDLYQLFPNPTFHPLIRHLAWHFLATHTSNTSVQYPSLLHTYQTYPVTFSISLRIVSVIFSFIPRFFCMASGPAKRSPPNFFSMASRPLSR